MVAASGGSARKDTTLAADLGSSSRSGARRRHAAAAAPKRQASSDDAALEDAGGPAQARRRMNWPVALTAKLSSDEAAIKSMGDAGAKAQKYAGDLAATQKALDALSLACNGLEEAGFRPLGLAQKRPRASLATAAAQLAQARNSSDTEAAKLASNEGALKSAADSGTKAQALAADLRRLRLKALDAAKSAAKDSEKRVSTLRGLAQDSERPAPRPCAPSSRWRPRIPTCSRPSDSRPTRRPSSRWKPPEPRHEALSADLTATRRALEAAKARGPPRTLLFACRTRPEIRGLGLVLAGQAPAPRPTRPRARRPAMPRA